MKGLDGTPLLARGLEKANEMGSFGASPSEERRRAPAPIDFSTFALSLMSYSISIVSKKYRYCAVVGRYVSTYIGYNKHFNCKVTSSSCKHTRLEYCRRYPSEVDRLRYAKSMCLHLKKEIYSTLLRKINFCFTTRKYKTKSTKHPDGVQRGVRPGGGELRFSR